MLYRNDKDRDVVAAAGKDGYLHIVDRLTHELVFKAPTTTVDSPPILPTAAGARVCPGAFGGTEWNGPAYDPEHKLVFAGAMDMCQILITRPGESFKTGTPAYGGAWKITADQPTGWISAFDAETGEPRWKYHTGAAMVAALTPTAGGILLSGDNSGKLLVFESNTGKLLKSIETGGSISGGIIAYEIKGREYIALTSGNVSRTGFATIGRPSVVVMQADLPRKTIGPKAPDVARGRAMYQRTCGACHAPDGEGVYGFSLANLKARMNTEKLVSWIKNPAPPMPKVFPEPLEDDDIAAINDIAAYLEQR
jgi:alcohol dehydrogenase (cytochrome c)